MGKSEYLHQGTLLPEEGLRHPMWTKPEANDMSGFVYALRRKIHSAVTPFDGRPNSERVVLFCQETWNLTGVDEVARIPFVVLVGEIAWLKARRVRSLSIDSLHRYERDAQIISRLGDEFIAHLDHHVRP